MTQVHNELTRENNLLDLIFTMNPSLIKSSTNIPEISDHAIIIRDMQTKPHYQKTTPKKRYIYSKANWNKIKEDLQSLKKNSGWDIPTRKHQITYGRHLKGSCFPA